MLDKFFIENTLKLNWEYIDSIPEVAKLKDCEQNPKWHGEGNAYLHTVRCINYAYEIVEGWYSTDNEKRMAIVAVLLHDIGKAVTTDFVKGNWHAYGHEFAGEKIARRLLWDENIEFRERICNAIRHHMEPLRIADSKGSELFKKIITPTFKKHFYWKDVFFVKACDVIGSIPEDANENVVGIEKLRVLSEIMEDLNCYHNGWNHNLGVLNGAYDAFVLNKKISYNNEQRAPIVYVMIGLPGSGKNTWLKKLEGSNCAVISRDDIRAELGFCKEGEKVVLPSELENKVSEVFNERFVEAIKNGKNVVLNNINLKKQYRDAYKGLIKEQVEWAYVYIEAKDMETLLKRRPTFTKEIYDSMIEKFDFPQPGEYDDLIIVKQTQ